MATKTRLTPTLKPNHTWSGVASNDQSSRDDSLSDVELEAFWVHDRASPTAVPGSLSSIETCQTAPLEVKKFVAPVDCSLDTRQGY